MANYEAKFLRLSRYAQGLVETDYDKSVQFEEGQRYDIKVFVAPKWERVFETLVEKAKIAEENKYVEREKWDKERRKKKIRGN